MLRDALGGKLVVEEIDAHGRRRNTDARRV
jgi:hypothetical protein